MRGLVIALHDVAPSTLEATVRWRAIVAGLTRGPVSLLVVPRYLGHDSWRSGPAPRWVRGRIGAGDETVLHGYSHLSLDGRDGQELAGREPRAIGTLIDEGLAEMDAAGLLTDGFIAPSYSHPDVASQACRAAGLGWWATRTSLVGREGATLRLPSIGLGASTAARRALSPTAARVAARLLSAAPAVRLDLHPADLAHPRLERAGRELLTTLLAQGRRPVIHGDLLPGRPPLPLIEPPPPGDTGVRAAA